MWTYGVPRRRLSPRSIALNVALVLAVGAALLTWFRIANVLTNSAPAVAPSAAVPSSFVWGDQVFSSQAQMAAWLRSKRINVSLWLRRHPDAARIINAQLAPSPARHTKTRQASKPVARRTLKTVSRPAHGIAPKVHATPTKVHVTAGPGGTASSGSQWPVVPVLVVMALLLAGLAFAPRRVWQLVLRRVPSSDVQERIYPAAGAAGILVALTIGFLFN